ncbi:hypothetical protein NA57DRAFT_53797 [Rhizodiscina lignyota]|uniref:tRNA-splicing endonuclease subunit Sen15 domain-containing protein n=1 Tax=Rhizodiscina lignyota TaxID=1504668 RepID=A0A9P4INW2_9PEZI|nr:hypothetical protein NA57DRAFT_53797 [Rhizodiscina lignyota]
MAVRRASSALQQLMASDGYVLDSVDDELSDWDHYCNLALQVLHNLQHQHRWTQLKLHTHSPTAPYARMSRPLLSGMPPRRLYVHPDEQIEFIRLDDERKKRRKAQEKRQVTDSTTDTVPPTIPEDDDDPETTPQPVREWVLPTHIGEMWSLRRMATVFDVICSVPPDPGPSNDGLLAENPPSEGPIQSPGRWREVKRLLLATVDDDSTIVYYIVHDGIVKPRQN